MKSLSAILLPIAFAVTAAHADEVTELVTVTVTGGPHAGTYKATATDGGCSYGLAGKGAWGNQFSDADVNDPKKLSSLQLIVPDAKKAAGGTDRFMITVQFGSILSPSADYTVDTQGGRGKGGSGKVTVHDGGKSGKVTFTVTTTQGVKLEGAIDCKAVVRAG